MPVINLMNKKTLQLLSKVDAFLDKPVNIEYLTDRNGSFLAKAVVKWGRKYHTVGGEGASIEECTRNMSQNLLSIMVPSEDLRVAVRKGVLEILRQKNFYKDRWKYLTE